MNCKQGDLAIRVSAHAGAYIRAGAIVRCIRFDSGSTRIHSQGGRFREVDGTWLVEWRGSSRGAHHGITLVYGIPDDELRPIRNPGEDETDETLLWLPVPHKEHA